MEYWSNIVLIMEHWMSVVKLVDINGMISVQYRYPIILVYKIDRSIVSILSTNVEVRQCYTNIDKILESNDLDYQYYNNNCTNVEEQRCWIQILIQYLSQYCEPIVMEFFSVTILIECCRIIILDFNDSTTIVSILLYNMLDIYINTIIVPIMRNVNVGFLY